MKNSILWIAILLLFFSCESWLGDHGMPQARGEAGEIILVMDSARWESNLGREIRLTFRETVAGLPREEPLFDLRHVVPNDFKGILKNAKNLVLVTPINDKNPEGLKMKNLFTPKSLDSLRENTEIFMINRRNLFATGQNVLFLIHRDDESFRDHVIADREQMQYYFNRIEERRAFEKIFKVAEEKMISNRLNEDYGFNLRVPYGFLVAMSSDAFVWLRLADQEIDKNIFLAFKEYTNTEAFSDGEIIAWRDEICKDYIYGNPEKPDSYLTTEMLDPPLVQEVNFNGKYGKKMVGRWKTNSISMGGPFVSYTFVDEATNRLYYIEGFIYSPGVDQRELIREMNVILKTFRTGTE